VFSKIWCYGDVVLLSRRGEAISKLRHVPLLCIMWRVSAIQQPHSWAFRLLSQSKAKVKNLLRPSRVLLRCNSPWYRPISVVKHSDNCLQTPTAGKCRQPRPIVILKSGAKPRCEPDVRWCLHLGGSSRDGRSGGFSAALQTLQSGAKGSSSRRFAYDWALMSRPVASLSSQPTKERDDNIDALSPGPWPRSPVMQAVSLRRAVVSQRSAGRSLWSPDDAIKADASTTSSHTHDFGRWCLPVHRRHLLNNIISDRKRIPPCIFHVTE